MLICGTIRYHRFLRLGYEQLPPCPGRITHARYNFVIHINILSTSFFPLSRGRSCQATPRNTFKLSFPCKTSTVSYDLSPERHVAVVLLQVTFIQVNKQLKKLKLWIYTKVSMNKRICTLEWLKILECIQNFIFNF